MLAWSEGGQGVMWCMTEENHASIVMRVAKADDVFIAWCQSARSSANNVASVAIRLRLQVNTIAKLGDNKLQAQILFRASSHHSFLRILFWWHVMKRILTARRAISAARICYMVCSCYMRTNEWEWVKRNWTFPSCVTSMSHTWHVL